jgi:hypothetical protein
MTMSTNHEAEQTRAWRSLFDQIKGTLLLFGSENYRGKADYLIVDDNYGFRRHTVEIHRLHMLKPRVVSSLQQLLRAFPDWEIVLAVDIPGKETIWPPMGVTIRRREIIDGLHRQYLPTEFQAINYVGSKPGTGFD